MTNNTVFQVIRIGITGVVFIICVEVHATDWKITPRVSGGVIYTDNVDLTSVNEEDDFITELGVGVSATRAGKRLTADIDYSLRGLIYAEDSDHELFHRLKANGSLEVSQNRFFIDASSSIYQQVIDRSVSGNNNNITTNDNRLSVFTAGISPRWRQPIGNSLELQANYRTALTSELESDSTVTKNTVDGTHNSVSVSLGNITNGHSLQWNVQYNQSRDDNEDNNTQEVHLENVRLNAFYPLTNFITLIGVVGEEDNSYDRNANSDDPDGSFWEAGARWQATAQNDIELRVGERFFGTTTAFSWKYQGKRFGSNVGYKEDIATTTQNILDGGVGLTRVIGGQTSITKRFNIGINYSISQSRISADVFETRNEFQRSLLEDRSRGASIRWQRSVGSRTQLGVGLVAKENEYDNQATNSDTLGFNVQISRALGSRTTGSLSYNYDELSSDTINEHEANTLTLRVNRTF